MAMYGLEDFARGQALWRTRVGKFGWIDTFNCISEDRAFVKAGCGKTACPV
jgi:hypothetical protein